MIDATKKISRIAESGALYSITWVQSQLLGAQSLSRGTRGYLWYFLALVKHGYETIAATQGQIADAYHRASGGNKSVRSLQYALKELEDKGFIRRSRYRVGDDNFRSVINLNKEAFSFWTRNKTNRVSPIPTQTHVSPYAQIMPKDNVREITPCNLSLSSGKEDKEPRTHTRSKKNARQFKFHPIIFSLLTVLKWPKVEPPEMILARAELQGVADLTEINWPRWEKEWQRLPIDEREGIVRTSFLPRLRSHANGYTPSARQCPKPSKPKPSRISVPEETHGPPATRAEVLRCLRGLSFYTRQDPLPASSDVGMSSDELGLLSQCRDSVQDRRKRVV